MKCWFVYRDCTFFVTILIALHLLFQSDIIHAAASTQSSFHAYYGQNYFPLAAQLFATNTGGGLVIPVTVPQGGTGQITLPQYELLYGDVLNPVQSVPLGASGTVLIGTGLAPVFSATPTVDSITINNLPVAGTDGANKTYVDLVAAGLHVKGACYVATTANLTATYSNGAAGVGATLTNSGVQVALSIDGQALSVGDRVLVKDQSSALQNGIYTVTNVGSGATDWVLTRATDYDAPSEIKVGDLVPVQVGTDNGGSFFIQTDTVVAVGVSSINFTLFLIQGIKFLAGDSGTATGVTVTLAGGNNILTTASGATVTIDVNGTTDHAVQVGNASGSLTSVVPSATSGIPLISQGVAADPVFGTAVVSGGGTGATTLTQYGVLVGNATSPVQSTAAGATGTVLIGTTGNNPSFSATPSVTSITINNSPVVGTDGANKAYVDLIAAGLQIKAPCYAATTASLTATYNNGSSGVGATLTNAGAFAVFSIDGQTPSVGSRVLIKNQASALQNGIYTVTNAGSGATNWILTRATDYDEAYEIDIGDLIPVLYGTVNGSSFYLETAAVVTIGVDPIVFTLFIIQGVTTLIGNSGSASGIGVTVAGGNNINTSGSGSTLTVNVSGTTNHAVQVGNASASLTSVSPSATSGIPLISQGAAADPTFGTAVVSGGGTGLATLTSYAIMAGGTTATGNMQQLSTGTSGQILISGGSSALPTWGDGIQTKTVSLTRTQIANLATIGSAVQCIAAPGAGKMIYVWSCVVKLTVVTTAFTSATGTIDLYFATPNGGAYTTLGPSIIAAAASNAMMTSAAGTTNLLASINGGLNYASNNYNAGSGSANACVNTDVVAYNPGAAFTGGGTSSATLYITYQIVTI